MKKLLLLLAMSLCSFGARANTDWFDFPVLQGTTLKCIITDASARTVTVVYNGADRTPSPPQIDAMAGSLVIPSTVRNGEDDIEYTVTAIGYCAFAYCSALTSVTIPNTVTAIEGCAFVECTSLESVTIGESVETIGTQSFADCGNLTSVTIPNTVTAIGDNAFSWCTSLESVTIPNSVTSIGSYAFRGCRGLTSVTIGNSVTTIGNEAFSDCDGLESVTIGNSVTTIGNEAFAYCSDLTTVTIPNSVTTIGDGAFSNCSGLTTVTIPNSVTTIGERAFAGCSGLTYVVIGRSVTQMGEDAFLVCNALETVYWLPSMGVIIPEGFGVAKVVDGIDSCGSGDNTIYRIYTDFYIVDDADNVNNHIPSSQLPTNFIGKRYGSSDWVAREVVLTDDTSRFCSPATFTADSVSYTREFADGHRSTLYLPFTAAIPENLEVYEFSDFDGSTLHFSPSTDSIRAYTPYLVGYGLEKSTTKCVISQKNVKFPATAGATPAYTTTHGNMTFHGTTERTGNLSTNNYGYKDGFFVRSGGAAHVNPFRCYFTYSGGAPSQMPPSTLGVSLGDGPLAIDAVEAPATMQMTDEKGVLQQLKVYETSFEPDTDSTIKHPTKHIISDKKNYLKISVSDGFVKILSLQMSGKRRISIEEFLRGYDATNWKITN